MAIITAAFIILSFERYLEEFLSDHPEARGDAHI